MRFCEVPDMLAAYENSHVINLGQNVLTEGASSFCTHWGWLLMRTVVFSSDHWCGDMSMHILFGRPV